MPHILHWLGVNILALLILAATARATQSAEPDPSLLGVFVGSTPDGESLRPLLKLPAGAQPPLRWRLTLRQNPQSHAPTRYKLRCAYEVAAKPGAAGKEVTLTKEGSWRRSKGAKTSAVAVVYELEGGIALAELDGSILHLLTAERSLMIGNGGWSYTLYREEAAEPLVDPSVVAGVPDMSYTISPLATGDGVFGVFEGRTPFQGIARQLKLKEHAAGFKAKWRVTLYQDARTSEPTTYKIEGTLFRSGAREGKWTVVRGIPDNPAAVVIELAATKTQPALALLQGDADVLFMLDRDQKPLVGHADFSYTLNRRTADLAPK